MLVLTIDKLQADGSVKPTQVYGSSARFNLRDFQFDELQELFESAKSGDSSYALAEFSAMAEVYSPMLCQIFRITPDELQTVGDVEKLTAVIEILSEQFAKLEKLTQSKFFQQSTQKKTTKK